MKKLLSFSALVIILFSIQTFGQNGKPQYLIETRRADTTLGFMTFELYPTLAPLHVAYFDSLVNINFYDTTAIHRVVPGFVIQGGDPNSRHGPRETWGFGDTSQTNIPAEFSNVSHKRGIIGAARDTDINSANSQYFVNVADNPNLNGNYTVYGNVIDGMDLVDFIVDVPRDANDNPNEKIEIFVTKLGINEDVPGIPVMVTPDSVGGAVFEQRVEWEMVEEALFYNIQASRTEDFNDLIADKISSGTSTKIGSLELGEIQYFWRIRSNNGGNPSAFSETRSFFSSIEVPVLTYPEDTGVDIPVQPEFQWEAVDGATYYRIQVAIRSNFNPLAIVFDSTNIITNTITPPQLGDNTKHYWRVQSFTDTYEGPTSESWSFTTVSATDIEEETTVPESFVLNQNYPNPFNPSTSIRFGVPIESKVRISIYNLLGEQIIELANEHFRAGYHEVIWNAGSESSGIYLVKMKADKYSSTIKVLLVK